MHVRPPSPSYENKYHDCRDPTWERPMPFKMLPDSPSSEPRSPVSDKSSNTSGSVSDGSLPKSPSSPIRQRLRQLRRSNANKQAATMSSKYQLGNRFLGEFEATDIYLQSNGNHPPPKPIVADQRGDQEEIASLIRKRADINHPHKGTGRTPLSVACHCGHNDIVELLIDCRGCQRTVQGQVEAFPVPSGSCQWSLPSHSDSPRPRGRHQCQNGHAEIASYLLTRGARVKGTTDTPMYLAASGGHVQVIQALLQHGGSVHELDAQGWDPLRRAAFEGHSQAVASLLGHGARATNLGALSSFSFASTTTTEQRQRILDLLTTAVDAENAEHQHVAYLTDLACSLNDGQDNLKELPVMRIIMRQEDAGAKEGLDATVIPPSSPVRPPPSPSRPPPAIPQIPQATGEESDHEATRPAPYTQPAPWPLLDLPTQQPKIPILQRILPHKSPSFSREVRTPPYLSWYAPATTPPPKQQEYASQAAAARLEALYQARTGTEENRAELE